MPLTIEITEEFYNRFKGSRGEENLIFFLRSKGIKFDKNTTKYFNYQKVKVVYTQLDVYALDEIDHLRYAKAFEEFLEKYITKPFIELETYAFDEVNSPLNLNNLANNLAKASYNTNYYQTIKSRD